MDYLNNFKAGTKNRVTTQLLKSHLFASNDGLPFVRRNGINQNVAVDVYGVRLWEDGVFILEEDVYTQYCSNKYLHSINKAVRG